MIGYLVSGDVTYFRKRSESLLKLFDEVKQVVHFHQSCKINKNQLDTRRY